MARHVPVRMIELPFRPPQIQVQQYWHRRQLFHCVNRRDGPSRLSRARVQRTRTPWATSDR